MWKITQKNLCVAISGLSGCGNTSVSKMLAERLPLKFVNYTFRSLAEEQGISFDALRILAQNDDQWDFKVDRRQIEISRREACVIGSRLAIWMVSHAHLKVYLSADERVRATRIQKREQGEFEKILHATIDRDNLDRERYERLYNIDINKYTDQVDLVIDVNVINILEVIDIILKGLQNKGLISQ